MANSENSTHTLHNSKFVDGESQELEDEEAFSYAMQLGVSTVLSMSLQSAAELGVFDVLQKAGPGAKLSSKEIASQLSCKNPEAPLMLDRVLRLLASNSILKCTVLHDDQNLGSFQMLYSMAPVAKFFARDSDGFSLGPVMALIQDNIFLQSWSVPVPIINWECVRQVEFSIFIRNK